MAEHKPDCGCKVCLSWQAAQAQRKAAVELEATRRDVAYFEVMGAGGPDAILALARQHGDTARAERLLAAGGFDVAAITDRHRSEAPAQQKSSPWAGDPAHDSRVTEALLRGASDAELARIMAGVAAEYAGKAAERQARQQSAVMWRTRDGGLVLDGQAPVIGASYGASGAPQQRSVPYPELGSA